METESSTSPNVLLVESDSKEADVYADMIREVAECKVDILSRISTSLDWIAQSGYQLVILDLSDLSADRKLNLDGPGLLESIRRISPDTSVIMITTRATVSEAVASIRMGAEDYFEKPFNLESFKLAVKRALDRKAVFGKSSGATGYFHLLNSCQMISASLEEGKIFEILKSYFSQELSSNYSAIFSYENGEPVRAEAKGSDQALDEILEIAVFASSPFEKMIEANEMFRVIDRGQLTPGLSIFRFRCVGPKDLFCVCLSPQKPIDSEAFESQLHMLRKQIEVTGNNIREYLGVKDLVYVDDATGLYNTRYLHFILDREIKKARKNKSSFAVLFLDADRFKGVNDNFGHLVGTKLLHELGARLKKHVRDDDTVFRYGGDEFVAVLSPCDLETAKHVASRIRESVEMTRFLAREGLRIRFTVSIGVALFPDHADSKKKIIEMADQAMYDAKKISRNCVYVIGESQPLKLVHSDGKSAEGRQPSSRAKRKRAATRR